MSTAGYAAYIICATPRSGSTLLCDLLTATGGAGAPDSFLMGNPDPQWITDWGLPDPTHSDRPAYPSRLLAAVRRAGRGATGICGLRLMRRDLPRVEHLLARAHPDHPDTPARLDAAFGRCLFIHLSRADKLAQAVSLIRARQSGLWHRHADGSERERLSPPSPATYDRAAIAAALADFNAQDRAWDSWFAAQNITPLRLTYEQLASAPTDTLARVCTVLGITPQAWPTPATAPVADATSRDWITRFRRETAR